MTPRDYLRRRKLYAIYGQCASAVLLFAGVEFIDRLSLAKAWPSYAAPFIMMLPFAFGMTYSAQLPACPACKASLYNFRLRPRSQHQTNFCPYCALRLDGPMPESERG